MKKTSWNRFIKTVDFEKLQKIQKQTKDENMQEGLKVFDFLTNFRDSLVEIIPALSKYKKCKSSLPIQPLWTKENGFRVGFYYGDEQYALSTQLNITLGASWGGGVFIKDNKNLIFGNKKILSKIKKKYPKFTVDKKQKLIGAFWFENKNIPKEKQIIKSLKKLVTILDLAYNSQSTTNSESYILLAGRAGSGKTDMLIAYANKHPKTTLFYSQENFKKELRYKGLKSNVTVVCEDTFNFDEIYKYDTICIDYIQLFDKEYIESLIKKLMQTDIKIIAVSHMRPRSYKVNNIFQATCNKEL